MNYDDIINLPHYEPKNHKRMSIHERAAQFSPFAALTGYEDLIHETDRLTDKKIEIDESRKEQINFILVRINELIKNNPKVEITYFVPDVKKTGGKYITEILNIKRVDFVNKLIKSIDNKIINMDEIMDITIINL